MNAVLELLLLILCVYWIGESFGENAESWALAILLIALIAALVKAGRDSDRAYVNFIRHWRDGGPDKK